MGEKRWSSKALHVYQLGRGICEQYSQIYLVRAYDRKQLSSSCGWKVPMQPLRFKSPFREIVFHVTNSGCFSFGLGRPVPREESEDRDVLGVPTSTLLLDVDEAKEVVDGRLLFELAALSLSCCVIVVGSAVARSLVFVLVVLSPSSSPLPSFSTSSTLLA